jgi:hypothetical protein
MLHFLLYSGIIIAHAPAIGVGQGIGDLLEGDEGLARAGAAGREMAWLLMMIASIEYTTEAT